MSKLGERRDRLTLVAGSQGYVVRTYSPGDGVTRYRFFELRELRRLGVKFDKDAYAQSYFGPANGAYTALGLAEAETFLGI